LTFPPSLIQVELESDFREGPDDEAIEHTGETIIAILRKQEAGAKTADVCRKQGIGSATLYSWKTKYGGHSVSEARPHSRLGWLTTHKPTPHPTLCGAALN
jgi:hypothetical protein